MEFLDLKNEPCQLRMELGFLQNYSDFHFLTGQSQPQTDVDLHLYCLQALLKSGNWFMTNFGYCHKNK